MKNLEQTKSDENFDIKFKNNNVRKAIKEKQNKIKEEYEIFDKMYANDGLITKCVLKL